LFNQKKSKLMQTKGQLMKSLNTAFSFAPPSILSLTIFQFQKLEFSYAPVLFYNHSVDNILHYL